MRLQVQALIDRAGGGGVLPEPRAVSLLGVDEHVPFDAFLAGHFNDSGGVGVFSYGFSMQVPASSMVNNKPLTGSASSSGTAFRSTVGSTITSRLSMQIPRTSTARRVTDSNSFVLMVDDPAHYAFTWLGGDGTAQGQWYKNGRPVGRSVDSSLNGGVATGYDTIDLAIGKGVGSNWTEMVFWGMWWIKVTLSAAQIAEVSDFLRIGDYIGESSGLLNYLKALDASARVMAVTSADDLTGGTGSITVYGGGPDSTPINTTPVELVAVPVAPPGPRAVYMNQGVTGIDQQYAKHVDVWSAAEVTNRALGAFSLGMAMRPLSVNGDTNIMCQSENTNTGLLEVTRNSSGATTVSVRVGNGHDRNIRGTTNNVNAPERFGISFAGGTAYPDLWHKDVQSVIDPATFTHSGTLFRHIAIGARGTGYSALVWWAYWGIKGVTLTHEQQVAIGALIDGLDIPGLVSYLQAISPTTCWLYWPDDTSDLTIDLPDRCGNFSGLQLFNLGSQNLDLVPTT